MKSFAKLPTLALVILMLPISGVTATAPKARVQSAACQICKELRDAKDALDPAKSEDQQMSQVIAANDLLFDTMGESLWSEEGSHSQAELSKEFLELADRVSEIDPSESGLEAFDAVHAKHQDLFEAPIQELGPEKSKRFLKKLNKFAARSEANANEGKVK